MSTSLRERVNHWLLSAQFWLLPGICAVCRRASGRQRDLCAACEARLPFVQQPCARCGLPLTARPWSLVCGTCLARPPPFVRCVAPLAWAPPIDALVAGFKYQGRLQHGRVLAPFLIAAIEHWYLRPTERPDTSGVANASGDSGASDASHASGASDASGAPGIPGAGERPGEAGASLDANGSDGQAPSAGTTGLPGSWLLPERILPVPLHPARLRERGYNQSAELGRLLSRALRLPLDEVSLRRLRATPPQRQLSARERRRNLRGAFALSAPDTLAGVRRVALLDDVVTTMSTARELALLLRRAGVEEVHLWALARA